MLMNLLCTILSLIVIYQTGRGVFVEKSDILWNTIFLLLNVGNAAVCISDAVLGVPFPYNTTVGIFLGAFSIAGLILASTRTEIVFWTIALFVCYLNITGGVL